MLSCLLAAAMAFTPADAHNAYAVSSNLVSRHTPRDPGTLQSARAARFLCDAASAAGLDARIDRFRADAPGGERWFSNVEAEYRGDPAASWVVLVSHFDTKPGACCPGANDGAATSGLLVALAECAARLRPRGANILFVWTDGEECIDSYSANDGLWGSRRAAARLKESGRRVAAVVCIDMTGDRDLRISIPRNVSRALAGRAVSLARAIGLGDVVSRSQVLVKDDHLPFLEAGFEAIDLIDFDYGSAPGLNDFWHTPEDTMDKVSEKSLLASGRLVAALIDALASPAAGKWKGK